MCICAYSCLHFQCSTRMDLIAKPYKCSSCEHAFAFETTLSAHKMIEHQEDPPHKCNICNLAFFNASIFSSHLIKHSLEKEKSVGYECCLCSVEFPSMQGLRVHMSHHSGASQSKAKPPQKKERFYKCQHCPSMFRDEEMLEEHSKIHDGNRVFRCKFCRLTFRLSSQYNLHLRRHQLTSSVTQKPGL